MYGIPNIAPKEPDNQLYEALRKSCGLNVEEIGRLVEHEINEPLDEISVAISHTQEGDTDGSKEKVRPHARGGLEDTS